MDLPLSQDSGVAIVRFPQERLDNANVHDFKQSFRALQLDAQRVILDLSALEFLDSAGLGALLSCLRAQTAGGGELRLCAMTPRVRSMVALVRLDRIFKIYDTPDEAVASYRS